MPRRRPAHFYARSLTVRDASSVSVGSARRRDWCLVRLWNFARDPRAFELRPPLDAHVSLMPTSFQASFNA